jgi:hypothetical protein
MANDKIVAHIFFKQVSNFDSIYSKVYQVVVAGVGANGDNCLGGVGDLFW